MQLKQLGVTLALAGMLSTQVYAHEAATEAAPLAAAAAQEAPANVLTQDDLVALFGAQEAGKPLQLAVLSEQEMRETEGALGPWGAVGGGIVGGIGNLGYQIGAGRGWSWGSFGYAVAGGALTGFTGGAAAWYVVPRVAFFGGIAAGRMGW